MYFETFYSSISLESEKFCCNGHFVLGTISFGNVHHDNRGLVKVDVLLRITFGTEHFS